MVVKRLCGKSLHVAGGDSVAFNRWCRWDLLYLCFYYMYNVTTPSGVARLSYRAGSDPNLGSLHASCLVLDSSFDCCFSVSVCVFSVWPLALWLFYWVGYVCCAWWSILNTKCAILRVERLIACISCDCKCGSVCVIVELCVCVARIYLLWLLIIVEFGWFRVIGSVSRQQENLKMHT